MTAWTPDIKIYSIPPNTSHDATRTEITDWVDYSISASRGTSEYIAAPYPAQTTITLLFPENVIPDIELGTWLEIGVYAASTGTWSTIHSGNVIGRSSGYRVYGLDGFVLEWQFDLVSGISILQNTKWYNEANYTGTTEACINKVYLETGHILWSQVNSNTTWQDFGPVAWDSVDDNVITQLPTITNLAGTETQRLNAGWRNVWDDITTLTYGVYGWMYEDAMGGITVDCGLFPPSLGMTITQDMISPDIRGGDSLDRIRNSITITEFDGVESTYYDDNSISLYAQRFGSISTLLTETLEAANVGQKMLNSLAYPLLSTEQISLNLLNPIFTDAERDLLLYQTLGQKVAIKAPEPMGGSQNYLVIGCQFNITKDAFIVGLILAPYSQQYSSQNWDQIPYNYTWTSYGVTFPTQEWQDL